MTDATSLFTPPHVMASVASLFACAAIWVFTRPAVTEPATYGKRIAGAMLTAFAVILAGFAYFLAQWSASA
ncbi:MAG: hypothetical protein ACKVOB_05050 [Sphingomonas sp.]